VAVVDLLEFLDDVVHPHRGRAGRATPVGTPRLLAADRRPFPRRQRSPRRTYLRQVLVGLGNAATP
jgi:hypothetical protein